MADVDKKMLVLFNTYWFNKDVGSGGVIRLVEVLKRVKPKKMTCLVNQNGKELFLSNDISGKFIVTPGFFDKTTIFGSYILRTLYSFGVLFGKKFKIIYSSSDFFPDVIPAFVFKRKARWVQVIHHIYPHWKVRPGNKIVAMIGYYSQKISFFMIKLRADRIIVVNPLVKKELVKRGFSERKIYVSSNAINVGFFDNIEKNKYGYDGIFLGRLNYCKGINDLPKIWEKVCQEMPESRLGIIGGGPENITRELKEMITKKNLEDKIDVLGHLETEKMVSLMKASRVFVFPSHEEGWGIAIAEAMACRLPVVSWNLPVYKEVFENYTVQVEENDICKFSEKVLEILKNPEKRERMSKEGYEFIYKYSWDEVAKEEFKNI